MTVTLISERTTRAVLEADRRAVIAAVAEAYLGNQSEGSNTPFSAFLRFPLRPRDRIIALLSHLERASGPVTGMKWVSSFPENLERGTTRAGATVLLNDPATGYLRTVLSAAPINAHRTAASAALVAEQLAARRPVGGRVGVIGAGLISTEILRYLAVVLPLEEILVADLDPDRATALAERLDGADDGADAPDGLPKTRAGSLDDAMAQPLVVLATTAPTPHLAPVLRPDQVVLHISLRDLAVSTMAAAHHVVDDIEHASREATSFGLAREQGDLSVTTVAQLLNESTVPVDVPLVFSPFGMGCLDLATADLVAHAVTPGDDGVVEWDDS